MEFHPDRFFGFDTNIIEHTVPDEEERDVHGMYGIIHTIVKEFDTEGEEFDKEVVAAANILVGMKREHIVTPFNNLCVVSEINYEILWAKVIIFNFLLKHIRLNATMDEAKEAKAMEEAMEEAKADAMEWVAAASAGSALQRDDSDLIKSLLKKHVYNDYIEGGEQTTSKELKVGDLLDKHMFFKEGYDPHDKDIYKEYLQCYKLFNMNNLWDFCFNGMLIYCYNQQRDRNKEFDANYNKLIELRKSSAIDKDMSIAIEVFIKMKIEEDNKFSLYTLFQDKKFLYLLKKINEEDNPLVKTMSETDYLAFTDYLKLFVLAKREELSIS